MHYWLQEVQSSDPSNPNLIATAWHITDGGDLCGEESTAPFGASMPIVRIDGVTQRRNAFDRACRFVSMNENGDVAGTFYERDVEPLTAFRAMAWLGTEGAPLMLQDLMPHSTVDSVAAGINAAGEVTGTFETPGPPLIKHAYRYASDTGRMVILDELYPDAWQAQAINAEGRVIGSRRRNGGFSMDRDGEVEELTFDPEDINDAGVIVGNRNDATPIVHSADGEVALPTFGTNRCLARAIGPGNHIVGSATTPPGSPSGDVVAVSFEGSELVNLNERVVNRGAWVLTSAYCVNRSGQILVRGRREDDPSRASRGAILTPAFDLPDWLIPAIFAIVLGGVVVDGPGFVIIGGRIQRVPPHNPEVWRQTWDRLDKNAQQVLTGLALSNLSQALADPRLQSQIRKTASEVMIEAATRLARQPAATALARGVGLPDEAVRTKQPLDLDAHLESNRYRRILRKKS